MARTVKWETEIFRGELAQMVKTHYRRLIAIGKCDMEAKRLIVDYCTSRYSQDALEKGNFWLALGLIQWQLGRLDPETKKEALLRCDIPNDSVCDQALLMLKMTLLSTVPEKAKLSPPRIRRCPWSVGSLLAYQICHNDNIRSNPYGNKYVLLHVVAIRRWPITFLAPEEYCNENVLVGLYHWVGDGIPDPLIASTLKFTPIQVVRPELSRDDFLRVLPEEKPDRVNSIIEQLIQNTTMQQVYMCVSLDWSKAKGIQCIGFDPDFERRATPAFKTGITECPLTGVMGFDIMLCNRLRELFGDNSENSPISDRSNAQ